MPSEPFKIDPLQSIDGIPCFCEENDYVANYEKIAADHLRSIESSGENPFMAGERWLSAERTTQRLIQKHAGDDCSIADIGVGLGRLLSTVRASSKHGTDVSLRYLQVARTKGIIPARAMAERLPYQDKFFDCVVTCDMLEHVFDLFSASAELVRILRPGGTLIVRVPNEERLESYLSYDTYDHVHVREFSLAGIRLHFQKIFRLEYIEHVFAEPYLSSEERLTVTCAVDADARVSIMKTLDQIRFDQTREITEDQEGRTTAAALRTLRNSLHATTTDIMSALYQLKMVAPSMFSQLEPFFAKPPEVTVVFRRP